MEAFTLNKTDAEIRMPDIEAELQQVRASANAVRGRNRAIIMRKIASVAACAIVVLSIGLAGYRQSRHKDNKCVAYVAGKRVTDESTVMKMFAEEIGQIGSDNESIEVQLNEFFNE